MPKISIDATLVTCQTDIQAKAGDMILVFEGNCLGVYRGLVKVPAATPTVVQRAQPASPSAKVAGASDGMDLVPGVTAAQRYAWTQAAWRPGQGFRADASGTYNRINRFSFDNIP